MDTITFLTLLGIILLFGLKPEPGAVFFMTLSLSEGPLPSLVTGAGTATGYFLILLLMLTGFDMLNIDPRIFLMIQILAALYIEYLGIQSFRQSKYPDRLFYTRYGLGC